MASYMGDGGGDVEQAELCFTDATMPGDPAV
jgi:hypothetical protein